MAQLQPKVAGTVVFLLILLLCLMLTDLFIGSVNISPAEILQILFGRGETTDPLYQIIWNFRIPRITAAMLAGAGLAISGLLMQTLFRNPIAGPFVLGISSGASLGVAILVMASSFLFDLIQINPLNHWNLAIFAILGSTLVLLLILSVAWRVRDIATLLIVGLMVGSATSALVTVLQYFSQEEALKRFILWGFGNLGGVTWPELNVLLPITAIGLVWALALAKSLNALLIGEDYAQSLGVRVNSLRYQVITVTAILAGAITAFCGPLAFIGIAVPHFARMLFGTQRHQFLLPATLLTGMIVLLFCDIISQVPFSNQQLPINAITSLMGAPVVVWIVLRKKTI